MITTKEQQESFRIAAEPLMLWLEENCHPHCTAIVDSLQAELVEGLCTKGAEAMSEDMPIGHTVYGQVESTDTPIADRLDTNGGAYATDEVRKLERENARLREELELIRAALTGDDYASLPSDLPTVRMAHTVRADHDKFRNQVRDTCHRAEQAEARALTAENKVAWQEVEIADLRDDVKRLHKTVSECEERALAAEKSHMDLIMQVARKWPNESRHETAKRYIMEAENRPWSGPDQAAVGAKHD